MLYYKKKNPVEHKALWNVKFHNGLLSDETNTSEGNVIFYFEIWLCHMKTKNTHTCKCFCLICWNSSKMTKITFVTHKHYNNVTISMIPKFLQPPFHIFVCQVLCNIIDQKGTYSSPVIPVCSIMKWKRSLQVQMGKKYCRYLAGVQLNPTNNPVDLWSRSNGLIFKS